MMLIDKAKLFSTYTNFKKNRNDPQHRRSNIRSQHIRSSSHRSGLAIQRKKTIVLSNTLQTVRVDAELYRGDISTLVTKLYNEGIKHAWIDGGATISQFLHLQIVDTMTLSIIPIILASGIPLFSTLHKEIPCHLIASQSYASGLVQLKYNLI